MMEIIPKSWFSTKIGEICQTTNKVDRRSIQKDKTFVYIDISSIDNTTNKIVSYKSYSWKEAPSRAQQIIYINDILFSTVRTYLKNIAIVDSVILNEQIASSGFTVLRTNQQIALPKLLFYFTLSQIFLQPLNELQTGTSYPAVRDSDVFSQSFPLPPLAEQHRIVAKIEELFSELDKGIETLKTAQQQLKVYRQAVLKYAFEGRLTNPDVKEGVLPEGWEVKLFKDVALIKRGKSKHRPRDAKELFGGPYPFIQTGDVRAANGQTIKRYSQSYSEFGLSQSRLWPAGTLCLTIAANIGDVAFLGFDACFPDSIVGVIPNEEMLNVNYLRYYMQRIKQELDSSASATAQKNLNVEILEKVNILLPSLADQIFIIQEIESRLSVCDKIEENIEQGLQQAEALRQSILKKAFEGKLVPQDPNDEPASVLLARIRSERGNTILSRNKRSKK